MNKQFTLSVIAVVIAMASIGATAIGSLVQQQQSVHAFIGQDIGLATDEKAPIVTSGDNAYIVWFSDKTPANDGEVFFRASNDNGATFGDKINLSNTTGVDSINAEINAVGDNVLVTWWEGNNLTSIEPVLRISTDNGETFGPLLKLATNGTIGGEGG